MRSEKEKQCNREYMRMRRQDPSYREKQRLFYREWYKKNGRKRNADYQECILEWQQEHPDRVLVKNRIYYAVKTGKIIKPLACEICRREVKLSAHHENYSKPFEVVWLCSSCHKLRHSWSGLDKTKILW